VCPLAYELCGKHWDFFLQGLKPIRCGFMPGPFKAQAKRKARPPKERTSSGHCYATLLSAPQNHTQRALKSFAGAVASVFFPGTCRLCEGLLANASRLPICEDCLGSFRVMPQQSCQLCSQPHFQPSAAGSGGADQITVCVACQQQACSFQVAWSFGEYDGPLAGWFAAQLEKVARLNSHCLEADPMVPVPLHRNRQKERSYNQGELFARPLAKRLKLQFRPVLVMRTRPRPEKHLLPFEECWEAVRGAFALKPDGQVDNLRILLLDDVMTTGATLDACAKALREAGASSVLGLTVARAVRPAGPDVVRF
jgi:competence protein ComFC